jgi:serine/threonine protein phosphatase PrpC
MGCKLSSNRDHDPKAPAIRRGTNQPAPMTKQQIEKRIKSINETCVATFGGVSVRYAWLSQRGYYPDRESFSRFGSFRFVRLRCLTPMDFCGGWREKRKASLPYFFFIVPISQRALRLVLPTPPPHPLPPHLPAHAGAAHRNIEANKANQDDCVVVHNFAGRESDAFLGVFDGHGNYGDVCAQYVTKHLPRLMAEAIVEARAAGGGARGGASSSSSSEGEEGELTKEVAHEAISRAHIACNDEVHRASFDDSLSGTTSISAYLQGDRNRITINNVGDSRAVIGRAAAGGKDGESSVRSATPGGNGAPPPPPSSSSKLKSYALSRDQTPYRLDERVRIRKTGARILSLDQVEGLEPIDKRAAELDEAKLLEGGPNTGELVLGEEIDEGGDPPRVWHPNGDYPGTAFTRSFGDAIAEELGVIALPEMLTHDLTPEDKIIVLASDGVFEFLTNQSVIDICAKFADPLEACRAVVAESYELWLQYELRTDDITMICIFVDGVGGAGPTKESESADQSEKIAEAEKPVTSESSLNESAHRPIRTKMTIEKARKLTKTKMNFIGDATSFNEDFDIESLYNEKTEEEKARIEAAISTAVVFQSITHMQRELIYKVLEPMEVKKGQIICKQGTVGDRFYIVDYGSFEVRILADDQVDEESNGGECVHVYEASPENNFHPSFGELALKYSAPRAASIIAQNDGKLWALHRYVYNKIKEN